MNPILAGVALAVTVGAVLAISARETRAGLVGLAIALGAAPFLAAQIPNVSTLAMRVIGAALAAYLVRAAVATGPGLPARPWNEPTRGGSQLGWPAEGLLAIAAWIVGVAVSTRLEVLSPAGSGTLPGDVLGLLTPEALATGAGLASIVMGLVATFAARSALRTTIGALILSQGLLLVRVGVAGAPSDLEQLAGVALLLAIAIAGGVLLGAEGQRGADDDSGTEPSPRLSGSGRVDPGDR